MELQSNVTVLKDIKMNAVSMGMTDNKVRCIAVTGGKGGVGKTNISINLATSLSKQNKRVMLLDADFGLANVDVVLGLSPGKNLLHVISILCLWIMHVN